LEDFTFHEAEPDLKAQFDFEASLFHHAEHLRLQASEGWHWFYISQEKRQAIVASVFLHFDGAVASSAVRSPFGTIEFSDVTPIDVLYAFIAFVEERSKSAGIRTIELKLPPLLYSPSQGSLLQTFLFNQGYGVKNAEAGTIRFTDGDFLMPLNRLERRQLRKCEEHGMTFKTLAHSNLESVYAFILSCRQKKGYTLSMTLKDLQRVMNKFADRYILLGVFDQQKMVAASVAVKISSSIVYNFYADHDEAYDFYSPGVMVVKGLYEYCQHHQIAMLDMGTSAVDGKPNFGLLNFKMRLGGMPTPKLTLEKNL